MKYKHMVFRSLYIGFKEIYEIFIRVVRLSVTKIQISHSNVCVGDSKLHTVCVGDLKLHTYSRKDLKSHDSFNKYHIIFLELNCPQTDLSHIYFGDYVSFIFLDWKLVLEYIRLIMLKLYRKFFNTKYFFRKYIINYNFYGKNKIIH